MIINTPGTGEVVQWFDVIKVTFLDADDRYQVARL